MWEDNLHVQVCMHLQRGDELEERAFGPSGIWRVRDENNPKRMVPVWATAHATFHNT
jgi:hypothetical protein